MSSVEHTPAAPGVALPRLGPRHLAGIAASLIAGAVVWTVGLPADRTVFDTALSDLTVPSALFVAFAGIVLVGTVTARSTWPVVDIVVASVLGVVGGFYFWGVAVSWAPLTGWLSFYPPASAVFAGLWLLPGVLGGLVIRRPGAAVFVELLAAVLEALLGNQWGFSTVWYGLLEGLGAEVVLAVLLYRAWGLAPAMLAGAGAGATVGLLDTLVYYPDFSAAYRGAYLALAVTSGAVIAGIGAWALTRALAGTGALAPLASGRSAKRV
ncbi:MAG: ECF transporter S component [Kineosporiaceae bacterium]|jgi:energy-coupling factor transport system permease protein